MQCQFASKQAHVNQAEEISLNTKVSHRLHRFHGKKYFLHISVSNPNKTFGYKLRIGKTCIAGGVSAC